MAHELEIVNGQARMMYAADGGIPWHQLGAATAGAVNSIAAAKAAGLDWDVIKVPMFARYNDPVTGKVVQRKYDGKYFTMRVSDGKLLGIVDEMYVVSQNAQAFQLLDEVIADLGLEAEYETAGSLRGGRQVFMTLRLQKDIVVGKGDRLWPYIGLFTGHDGYTALDIFPTAVRWVCANTVRLGFSQRAQGGDGRGISLYHMGDWDAKIREAKAALNLSLKQLDDFELLGNKLADIKATPEMEEEFAQFLIPLVTLLTSSYKSHKLVALPGQPGKLTLAVPESDFAAMTKLRTKKVEIFKTVRGEEDASAWGLFNAGTGYIDHKRPYMWSKGEARLNSCLFGAGAAAKARALTGIKVLTGLS